MKLYLDTCAIQRPLDSRSQLRIALEVEALLSVLALVEKGTHELVSSEVLDLETDRIADPVRRLHARILLNSTTESVQLNDRIEARARIFTDYGLQPMDALHLACAEDAECDFFCTCDDRFLARAKAIGNLKIAALSPLELVEELDL